MNPNELESILRELEQEPALQEMKRYIQHGRVTTYAHCRRVARTCYILNQRLRLGADRRALVRAAMLHDFYLYDWHERDASHKWHGFRHADAAVRNARRYFSVGDVEREAISCHMWPLNLSRLPRRREAWILCLADKYCSLAETLFHR